jgi:outer membrane protein assembly factor BamA
VSFRFVIILFSIIVFNFKFVSGTSFFKKKAIEEIVTILEEKRECPFFVEKISFETDVPFSCDEFFYLIDFKEHSEITCDQVYNAYKNLILKDRFAFIDLIVTKNKNGKCLHFKFISHWILKKIVLKGIWFDSHKILQCYLQHTGDVFDGILHEESIEAIQSFLKGEGYFNASVNDELKYDKKNKAITVNIFIKKDKAFRIKDISCEFIGDEFSEVSRLKQKINTDFCMALKRFNYSRKKIKKVVDGIKGLLEKNGFYGYQLKMKRRVNVDNHEISIIFSINIKNVCLAKFVGNEVFSTDVINKIIKNFDISIWNISPGIIVQNILREYYKKGYWNAEIRVEKHNGHFLFIIKEGKPFVIDSIILKDGEGNNLGMTFFNDLLEKKYFDDDTLNCAIDNMKTFYLSKGFWDVAVIEKKVSKNEQLNLCTIVVVIKKGVQRFLSNVICDETTDDIVSFLKKYKEFPALPFDPVVLEEQQDFLIRYLQKQGYWYVDVKPELSILDQVDKKVFVSVSWNINKGEVVSFGKVILRGLTSLPFEKVLKSFEFKKGDLWDRKKLDESRKNLRNLDIFSFVQLQPCKLSKQRGEKPIAVSVLDDDPLEIRIRAGYFLTSKNFLFRRQSTAKFGGSVILKNPFNRADKFICDVDYTKFEQHFVLNHKIPQPLNFSVIGKSKIYVHRYIHPASVGTNESAYEAIQDGFLFGFEKKIKADNYLGFVVGNEWMETKRVRGNINLSCNMINKNIPYFFIEPSFVASNVDDHLNPNKGTISFASLKVMVPEKTGATFCKFQMEQSFFFTLRNSIVNAFRFRFGHILKRSFNTIMPIERFYLGGPNTVRGYEKDALPPFGISNLIEENGNNKSIYTIQGGSSMLNGNFEIRFPVYKSFGAVLFQDIGVLSQSGCSGFKERWYPTSGFGFRYKTLIGALRFDIGWKWKRFLPEESSYVWYLTLGHAF